MAKLRGVYEYPTIEGYPLKTFPDRLRPNVSDIKSAQCAAPSANTRSPFTTSTAASCWGARVENRVSGF